MNFDTKELANVLIVALLLLALIKKRDSATLLILLFLYGTLHFGFAEIALNEKESGSLMIALHKTGGGLLAKLSALSLLGVVFVLLSRRAYSEFLLDRTRDRTVIVSMLLVMVAIFAGYLLNLKEGDWLQLKNVISLEALFAFSLVGFFAIKGALPIYGKGAWWCGFLMFGGVDCLAIYEVFTHSSWAGTLSSSGVMVYRASSTLFNPNLLGFLASLVYLGFAYGLDAYKQHRTKMIWGMALSTVAIYFSGSRSSGYLLFMVLFVPMLLQLRKSWVWLSLMLLPLTMLIIYAGAEWVAPIFVSETAGWHEIALLGERFAVAPVQLMNYGLMKVGHVFGISLNGVVTEVPREIVESIEGRFVGESRDAGWLVLYQDTGWLGLGAVMLAASTLVARGVGVCVAKQDLPSIYALAALLFCLMSGFYMRFHIFPVWLFISLILMLCLALGQLPRSKHLALRS